jgi:two-component sensor histidine kinase
MAATLSPPAGPTSVSPREPRAIGWLARRPTGAKLFMILSIALLPLALIAIWATLQTTRLADAEARARLRVAADESAHAIGIELVGDMTALRVALNALGSDPADAPSCARAQGIFAQQSASGTRFLIADRAGRPLCGQPLAAPHAPVTRAAPVSAQVVPGRGLILAISGPANTTAQAYFPVAFLARIGTPSTRATLYGSTLEHGEDRLPLAQLAGTSRFNRSEATVTDVGIAGLTLRTSVRAAPITSPLVVALLLPVLMWAAAASIGWFVVDRLLIRPLRQLRASVASFTPGEVIDPGLMRALPAQEIRELGDTFRAISRTVALHEAGLAEGLVRQTKLTREVHHRVKNNLQVIASLINFHARGAPSADAMAAYGSIQRRVDALAVVHRNHFADVEENRGLDLRAMIGELATGLRSSAAERQPALAITLDVEPLLVTQDVAVAVAFLVTEIVELAMTSEPGTQVRVGLRAGEEENRAVLRVVSRALVERDQLHELVATRYGRVLEGLARQLRSKLHHDPLVGAYEITIAVLGRA